MKPFIRLLAWLLALVLSASGCAYSTYQPEDPPIGGDLKSRDRIEDREGTEKRDPLSPYHLSEEARGAYLQFTADLLKVCADDTKEENVLLSPLSILTALAMTAEGAGGNTLTEMEEVLGLDRDTLGAFLSAYLPALPEGESYRLTAANSIWLRDTDALQVKKDFLDTCARLYDASVHREAFDKSTADEINDWVSDNTDGMIQKLLEDIPANVMLYLINALAFDAKWEKEYSEWQVRESDFTDLSGKRLDAKMMYSSEDLYVESEDGVGFVKFYQDRAYAFVGFLPDEALTPDEWLASLTGEKLDALLASAKYDEVNAALPAFTSSYGVSLKDGLKKLGLTHLFDSSACNLTDMALSDSGNLYVSNVLHKTFIDVSEQGTRAAAVTAVEVEAECAPAEPPINVILDRPFVYMILDWENRLPIFIGTTETLTH